MISNLGLNIESERQTYYQEGQPVCVC